MVKLSNNGTEVGFEVIKVTEQEEDYMLKIILFFIVVIGAMIFY